MTDCAVCGMPPGYHVFGCPNIPGTPRYRVTSEHDGSDSSDQVDHTSMVEAVKDMVAIGQQSDAFGPFGWTIEELFPEEVTVRTAREPL